MSHFSVTVILDKEKVNEQIAKGKTDTAAISLILDEVMKKYDEDIEVAPYISKTVGVLQKEYESALAGAEGKDSRYSEEWCKLKKESGQLDSYQSFIGLMYDEEDIDEEGNVLSTYNPNAKYDYYGPVCFLNKSGEKVDRCKVKDKAIYRNIDKEELQKDYEELISENPKDVGDRYVKFGMNGFAKKEYLLNKYPNFEAFLDQKSIIYSYAILTEKDEWIEPGKMGWFGSSSATPEAEGNFHKIYKDILEKTDPEHYVVVLDCHI